MNFLNTAAEATAASAAALASSDGGNTMTITEALGLSVTGIAVVMIILALLAVLVVILSKIVRFFEKAARKKNIEKNQTISKKISLPITIFSQYGTLESIRPYIIIHISIAIGNQNAKNRFF